MGVPRSARRSFLVPLVALALAIAPSASAEPEPPAKLSPAEREKVLSLYNQGKELVDAGKTYEGCRRFEEAKQIDRAAINLLLRLADCYERLGRTATAWRQYKETALIAAAYDDPRSDAARAKARALEQNLAYLKLQLPPGAATTVEVRRNGVTVPADELGKDIAVDPGGYSIEAAAPGRPPWRAQREVAPGASITIEIPASLAIENGSPPRDVAAPPPSAGLGPRRIAAIAVASAGLAGLGVGAAFGIKALVNRNDSNAPGRCDQNDYCDDVGYALRKDAQQAGTVSTIGFIAGGAAIAAGAVLWFTAPRADSRPAAPARVPRVDVAAGPGGGMLQLQGVF